MAEKRVMGAGLLALWGCLRFIGTRLPKPASLDASIASTWAPSTWLLVAVDLVAFAVLVAALIALWRVPAADRVRRILIWFSIACLGAAGLLNRVAGLHATGSGPWMAAAARDILLASIPLLALWRPPSRERWLFAGAVLATAALGVMQIIYLEGDSIQQSTYQILETTRTAAAFLVPALASLLVALAARPKHDAKVAPN